MVFRVFGGAELKIFEILCLSDAGNAGGISWVSITQAFQAVPRFKNVMPKMPTT